MIVSKRSGCFVMRRRDRGFLAPLCEMTTARRVHLLSADTQWTDKGRTMDTQTEQES
jgi:hypothetical protein